MANSPQTWTVTPAQYATMLANVNAAGLALSGNGGEVEKDGVNIGWNYDGTTLSITVLSAPLFMTGLAEREIANAVNGALGIN